MLAQVRFAIRRSLVHLLVLRVASGDPIRLVVASTSRNGTVDLLVATLEGPGTLRHREPPKSGPVSGRQNLRQLGRRTLLDRPERPQALASLEWADRYEKIVVCGPWGTANATSARDIGHQTVTTGMKVVWFSFEDLGELVRQPRR